MPRCCPPPRVFHVSRAVGIVGRESVSRSVRKSSTRHVRREIRRGIIWRKLPDALCPAPAAPARRMRPAALVATSSGEAVRIPARPGSVYLRMWPSLLLRRLSPTPTSTRVVEVRLLSIWTYRPAPSSASGCVWPESPRLQVLLELPVVSFEFSAHDDAFRGVVALPLAVVRAVCVRLASPAVPLAISLILSSIPPSPVAPTHAGCDQGVPRLLSLLSRSPAALQLVGSSPEQIFHGTTRTIGKEKNVVTT